MNATERGGSPGGPACPGGVPATRAHGTVAVGDALGELAVPVTRTLIVATALASRDYQDVHHDPDLARARGSQDIFMNILTTNGLIERYVTGWAGPGAVMRSLRIRLGVPNHPGDTMLLTGTVTATSEEDRGVEIAVTGAHARGTHVTGTVVLRLPEAAR